MTPTEQIEQWIAEHGSTRDALNIALSRLEACQHLLADAEAAVKAWEKVRAWAARTARREALHKSSFYSHAWVENTAELLGIVADALAETEG